MKGDITRSTFLPEKHYSGVRSQQGRVEVDADRNEQLDLQHHRDRTTGRDVIGPCGAPLHDAGFGLSIVAGEVRVGAGRFYADGILCEREEEVPLTAQPDLPGYLLPDDAGVYLGYLDVWEHHVTALEDPSIREVALGGPDTATRSQVLAQVRLLQAGDVGDPVNCLSNLDAWDDLVAPSTGTLTARAEPEAATDDPCIVPARAGFRGLENQLYRVEIHEIISDDEVAIKWSRENGAVVFAWLGQDALDANRLTVASTGRDEVLGLAPGDWVELTDDDREKRGEAGLLVEITGLDGTTITIDPQGQAVDFADFTQHPKVRRWDMPDGAITVDRSLADNWIALENGIEVLLSEGTSRVGDYWLIPARTVTGDITWPRDLLGNPLAEPPHGIAHHYCRLALLEFDGVAWSVLSDCRVLFPPLTELAHLCYVSGDGQEAMPGDTVPQPLVVAVMNGQTPVAGATVRFAITQGTGTLLEATGFPATGAPGTVITVQTDAEGLAACTWQLSADFDETSQQVEATWRDAADAALDHPIRFNANLSIASQVAYESGECLLTATTVEEALDQLCGNLTLYYMGGDGQAVAPDPTNADSRLLTYPLEVRVANGQWPVAGQTVTFRLTNSDGELLAEPGFVTTGAPGDEITVTTNTAGVAACRWRLGEQIAHQQAEATFTDDGQTATVHFNARLDAIGDVPGILVRDVRLNTGRTLPNDGTITLDELARGLTIDCDEAIDPAALTFVPGQLETGRAVCFVTFDFPVFTFDNDVQQLAGYFPVTLAPQTVAVDDNLIVWVPTGGAINYLSDLMAATTAASRFLVRLTLKGNFIWAAGDPDLYLDGEAYGARGDGRTERRTDLRGDGRRGGDLELWCWLLRPVDFDIRPVGDIGFTTGTLTLANASLLRTVGTLTERLAALEARLPG